MSGPDTQLPPLPEHPALEVARALSSLAMRAEQKLHFPRLHYWEALPILFRLSARPEAAWGSWGSWESRR